jgi:hypothetical protein
VSIRLYVLPLEHNFALNSIGPKYLPWSRDPDSSDVVPGIPVDGHGGVGYGHNWGIFAVEGTTAAHAALAAKTDVRQIPVNLDNNVGSANLATVRTFLEDAGLPGNWVAASTTWREVIRTILGLASFAARYDGIRGTQWGAEMAPWVTCHNEYLVRLSTYQTDHDWWVAQGSVGPEPQPPVDGCGSQPTPPTPFQGQIVGKLNVRWDNIPTDIQDAVLATGADPEFNYDMSFISASTTVRAILKQLADLWEDTSIPLGLEPYNGGQTFRV